jgi:hypothetical protein
MNAREQFQSDTSHDTDKSGKVLQHQKSQWTRIQLPSRVPSREAIDDQQRILPDGNPPPVILWGSER